MGTNRRVHTDQSPPNRIVQHPTHRPMDLNNRRRGQTLTIHTAAHEKFAVHRLNVRRRQTGQQHRTDPRQPVTVQHRHIVPPPSLRNLAPDRFRPTSVNETLDRVSPRWRSPNPSLRRERRLQRHRCLRFGREPTNLDLSPRLTRTNHAINPIRPRTTLRPGLTQGSVHTTRLLSTWTRWTARGHQLLTIHPTGP